MQGHIPCSLPEKLGIIGELMSRLEPDTLKYYVDPEKQLESESDKSSEGSSGDDSDTSIPSRKMRAVTQSISCDI